MSHVVTWMAGEKHIDWDVIPPDALAAMGIESDRPMPKDQVRSIITERRRHPMSYHDENSRNGIIRYSIGCLAILTVVSSVAWAIAWGMSNYRAPSGEYHCASDKDARSSVFCYELAKRKQAEG